MLNSAVSNVNIAIDGNGERRSDSHDQKHQKVIPNLPKNSTAVALSTVRVLVPACKNAVLFKLGDKV